jgi:hypothetical protein
MDDVVVVVKAKKKVFVHFFEDRKYFHNVAFKLCSSVFRKTPIRLLLRTFCKTHISKQSYCISRRSMESLGNNILAIYDQMIT